MEIVFTFKIKYKKYYVNMGILLIYDVYTGIPISRPKPMLYKWPWAYMTLG